MNHGCNRYVHVRVGQEKCPNVCRIRPRSGFDGVRNVYAMYKCTLEEG